MSTGSDPELDAVVAAIKAADPAGKRTAQVLRDTFDQLYDGQRTGRYRWDQLYKTEKTHCGTLVEINLHREFQFGNGVQLDYQISGIEVDCKYSQKLLEWMIPPEAHNKLCLLLWANDQDSLWSMGIMRVKPEYLGATNRDMKARLKKEKASTIQWIFRNEPLPPNVLLQLKTEIVDKIMAHKSGWQRTNELFRNTLGLRVGRAVVATVAKQNDYMRRVRGNGGARESLKKEGIVILGQFNFHRKIAEVLGTEVPDKGESVAVRLVPAKAGDKFAVIVGGKMWRAANSEEPVVEAPDIPNVKGIYV